MTIDDKELIKAISILAKNKNIQMTVRQSSKGGVICGVCCFVGGLLLGPAGLALGGAAGGVAAYNMTKGSFRSLCDIIINDLSKEQKERLLQHVIAAIRDFHPSDLVTLLPLILNNSSIKQLVLKAVINFVSKELDMVVANKI